MTSQPDPSDAGWCERLFDAEAPSLILYGRSLGLSHAEAEDVLQDLFLALLRRASPPDDPERYSVRAFRNRAMNYRRSLWRRLAREFESKRWFEPTEENTAGEESAVRCLRELPLDQREVMVLKIWHRHTFEEIGQLLGISPHTAAGRYRYGLRKLQACLKGAEHAEPKFDRGTVRLMETPATFGKH